MPLWVRGERQDFADVWGIPFLRLDVSNTEAEFSTNQGFVPSGANALFRVYVFPTTAIQKGTETVGGDKVGVGMQFRRPISLLYRRLAFNQKLGSA